MRIIISGVSITTSTEVGSLTIETESHDVHDVSDLLADIVSGFKTRQRTEGFGPPTVVMDDGPMAYQEEYEAMMAQADAQADARDAPPQEEAQEEADGLPDYMDEAYIAALNTGRDALHAMLLEWLVGFNCGVDDANLPLVEQPDRMKLIERVMAVSGASIFAYIDHLGREAGRKHFPPDPCTRGLRAAIRSVTTEDMVPDGEDFAVFTDALAGNIVQLASISAPLLAETIEYTYEDARG